MSCSCGKCNGIIAEHELGTTKKFAHEPVKPERSIHDALEDVYELLEAGLVVQAQVLILKIKKEVDLLDGELNELQKAYARRGDGNQARELGTLSQKLF